MDAGRDANWENMVPLARPDLTGRELEYVTDAIKTGWLTHHGSYEQRFEREFSELVGRPALATSSGTAALHLAMLSLGIGYGDEVIVPTLTFGATASAVMAVGAKPVFVDVNSRGCLDPRKIPEVITKKTKAIIPVHLYGEACDMATVKAYATMYDLKVIEDSCEALGLVPPTGDLACYSFYANKIITTGAGGMLVGDLGRAEEWRNGGFDSRYRHEIPGLNYRMTNIQAAIGCGQLERLGSLLRRRLEIVGRYRQKLKGFGRWLFCAECDPQQVSEALKGVCETRPLFYPLHMSPAYEQVGDFPTAVRLWKTHICLPTGPHVTEQEQERIIDAILRLHSVPIEHCHVA
jgi:perosamine synthetase